MRSGNRSSIRARRAYNTWTDDGGLHARATCSETVDSPCADGYGARLRTEFRRHPALGRRRRSAGRPRDGCAFAGPSFPPNFETPSSDQFVHTTWTTTVSGGKRVRNTPIVTISAATMVWVELSASSLLPRRFGASDEPWAADPALPETQQAKIYPSSAGGVYQYWVADLVTGRYGSGYWSRGHG